MMYIAARYNVGTLLLLCLALQKVNAVQFIRNTTVPANVTGSCAVALSSDVNCSPVLSSMRNGMFYSNKTLDRVCTQVCGAALATYQSKVAAACSGQNWNGYGDVIMPVATIPDLLRYSFNLTCLMDSGRYCNGVAAAAAGAGATVGSGLPGMGNITAVDQCDLCFIRSLQFQASSPYYDGPLLAERSIYQSKTSSCKVTGYPLSTTPLAFPTPSQPQTTLTPCLGKTYDVKSGDTCYSISKNQGIGTGWLLSDNNLAAYCDNFPQNGSLCLRNTCGTYTVKQNETCTAISRAYNISEAQLKAWNPVIDMGCHNMYRLNGSMICISSPGKPYEAPPSLTLAPTIAMTAAPLPTNVAVGTNARCGRYHIAQIGEYCNLICLKYGMPLNDFVFLNSALNANCTNLFAEESYCVQAVGDIDTYSGRPGFSTVGPTKTVTAKFSNLPAATFSQPTATVTGRLLANGTRDDCDMYFDGAYFQSNVSGNTWNSNCAFAAEIYEITVDALAFWNPDLGNTTLPTCRFRTGLWYCAKAYVGDTDPAPSTTAVPLPIRGGAAKDCTAYEDVDESMTCKDALDNADLTIAQFYALNPAIGADCASLWTGYSYCIAAPSVPKPATTTGSGSTTSPAPTSPVLPGQPSDCVRWHTVKDGDSCSLVEDMYFITSAQFLKWNPAVSKDCAQGFWQNYAYCVGVIGDSPTRSSPIPSSSTTPIASPTGIATPTPVQPNNAVSNCNKFGKTVDGDYCAKFADRNKITVAQLYTWNGVLGADGSGCNSQFWLGYYYCVGVAA